MNGSTLVVATPVKEYTLEEIAEIREAAVAGDGGAAVKLTAIFMGINRKTVRIVRENSDQAVYCSRI